MPKPKQSQLDLAEARSQIIDLLDNFIALAASNELRSRVLAILPAFHILRKIGTTVIPEYETYSARERILVYFQHNVLTVIDSEELMVVSGIIDYQRRIRELRVQEGWPIFTGQTVKAMLAAGEWSDEHADFSKMKPDEYILSEDRQDREAAHRWHTINRIRKEKLSVQDKLLKLLRENVGRAITGEELMYVANGKTEWARRTRELRTEKGWPIRTKNTGRPDLPVGAYVLEEDKQAEPHDRKIEDEVRVKVLQRDGFKCRKCGWDREQRRLEDPRRLLELHHLDYHAEGGKNEVENLITLCNVDHDTVHREHMTKYQVLTWVGVSSL